MKPIIIEDNIFDFEPCEEDGSVLLAEETPWRGFADELQDLHYLKGVQFINQLKLIVNCGEFRPIAGETNIFSAIGEESSDYDNLINAARKLSNHGYRVYILPNPKGIRTADFIFERKGVLKQFDLKTITGKNSVGNRLTESLGQTERVLLYMRTDYNIRHLTQEIKRYFEKSADVQEVLIYSGGKEISIKRNIASSKGFLKMMMNSFR
ncbi:hypothetical protein L6470_06545 [Prevotella communis]|uniref:CdiA C-terminal domain-containing protein n=1 Tax=Prevotella communis TaxID=2913614 RepID=UPI001EDBBCDA|nr:hypothetical protein [Prevotella communis]UKK60648.1 hypothetical protein L6470_06545 [Prevotella communis]